jgi:hypothetical protein
MKTFILANLLFALVLMVPPLKDPAFLGSLHVTPVAGGGDDCSDANLLFSWHMENENVTLGTPAGCSDGDETATLNSGATIDSTQFQDGANSLSCPTGSDYAGFAVSGNDIFSETAGTIIFYLRINTGGYVTGANLFSSRIDPNNRFEIYMQGADTPTGREIFMRWDGAGTTQSASTSDADLDTNTWYKITAKYDTADVDPNLSLQIDSETPVTNNNNLVAWSGSLSAMNIGNTLSAASDYWLDNIKVYDNWQ